MGTPSVLIVTIKKVIGVNIIRVWILGKFTNKFKENGYTLRENTSIYYFASLLSDSQVLKERICSLWSKFFRLRVDPIMERLLS